MTEVKRAHQVKQALDQAAYTMIQAIDEVKNEFWQQVENVTKALTQVHHIKEEKTIAIQQIAEKLQVDLATMRNSCELATNVVQSGSVSDIISLYPPLSSTLQQLAESQLSAVDINLGEIQLEPPRRHTRVDLPSLEQLLCDKLNITMPSRERNQVGNQTNIHLSAEAPVDKLLPPLSEPPSSSSSSAANRLSFDRAVSTAIENAEKKTKTKISSRVNLLYNFRSRSHLPAEAPSVGKLLPPSSETATAAADEAASAATTATTAAVSRPLSFFRYAKSSVAPTMNDEAAADLQNIEGEKDAVKTTKKKPHAGQGSRLKKVSSFRSQPKLRKVLKECGQTDRDCST